HEQPGGWAHSWSQVAWEDLRRPSTGLPATRARGPRPPLPSRRLGSVAVPPAPRRESAPHTLARVEQHQFRWADNRPNGQDYAARRTRDNRGTNGVATAFTAPMEKLELRPCPSPTILTA